MLRLSVLLLAVVVVTSGSGSLACFMGTCDCCSHDKTPVPATSLSAADDDCCCGGCAPGAPQHALAVVASAEDGSNSRILKAPLGRYLSEALAIPIHVEMACPHYECASDCSPPTSLVAQHRRINC